MCVRLIAAAVVMGGLIVTSQLHAGQAPQAPAPHAWQQLADEVKNLRNELFQLLHEGQAEKVAALEREVDQVHHECARIDEALQAQEREMTEWMNELQTSDLSPEDRAQAESAKREAQAGGSEKLRARRVDAVAREAELVQRLSREKSRLQRLREAFGAAPR